MKFFLRVWIIAAGFCSPSPAHTQQANGADPDSISILSDSSIIEMLTRIGYSRIFHDHVLGDRAIAFYEASDKGSGLSRIVTDSAAPGPARFLSAEILWRYDPAAFLKFEKATLLSVYENAFLNNFTGVMGHWGFNNSDDDLGELGSRFVELCSLSDAPLRKWLDNETKVQFAKIFPDRGALYPIKDSDWRIKDFAALYLSRIHRIPIDLSEEVEKRDLAIMELWNKLP